MARLPQLLDALASADTRRERSWFDSVSRAIREDGLLPPSVRGRGATVLGTQDAANLLLACLAPVTQAEAATAAQQFRSLRRLSRSSSDGPGALAAVAGAQLFGDALELLIDGADELGLMLMSWVDEAHSNLPEPERRRLLLPRVEVMVRSNLSAEIAVYFNRDNCEAKEFSADYTIDFLRSDLDEFYSGPFSRKSDTVTTVSVGLPTLLRLYDALIGKDVTR